MRTSPSRYKVAMVVTVHVGHTIGSVQSGSVSDKGPIKTDTKYLAQDGSEKEGGIATLVHGSGAAAGGRSASRGRGMVSSVVDVVETRARNVSERRK